MLGKLIKNEWISTWKVPTILCVYLGVLTLLACISFSSPLWSTDNIVIASLLAISTMIYIVSLFATVMIVFIYFVSRFYRNMYTDEGYLMHTLPVTAHQHVVAKGLVFLLWQIISIIAVILSVAALILTAFVTSEGVPIAELFAAIKTGFTMFLQEFHQLAEIPIFIVAIWLLLLCLSQGVSSIAMVYGAISIGQTFHKYRVMASIGAYFALSIITQTVYSLVSLPLFVYIEESATSATRFILSLLIFISVTLLLTCLGFYALTVLIMKKQLNLE